MKKEDKEQIVTPWVISGEVEEGVDKPIDYDKLIKNFGVDRITDEIIEKLEKVTGKPAHYLLRRGIFFAHRDFDKILDVYSQGGSIFLYTGRGPSKESLHLGHGIPLMFCKYLQDIFDAPLVIQITDDEKFLFKKDLTLEQCKEFAMENIKDIISFGFDPEKTFIFMNSVYYGVMFDVILKVQKLLSAGKFKSVFGLTDSDSIGKFSYPCAEIAAAFPIAFPEIFLKDKKKIHCLIPSAVDQDPYFRLARDISNTLGCNQPATIYSSFFPALQGFQAKMSSSIDTSAIFLSDTESQMREKINKYAFSGGKDDIETHRKHGGNPEVDVAYNYMKFIYEDDKDLQETYESYKNGSLLSGELKNKCINILASFLKEMQEKRCNITKKLLENFMDCKRVFLRE